ncbi:MFS transporter [Rheinheimera sp.]|uniref:MFS transporter n=1 Tax=Rheinheimera sp. TaxID=1869214 RepID=UPI003AF5977E
MQIVPNQAPGAQQRTVLATRILFFCSGFATAAWAAIIPLVKANAAVSEGTLGLLLLCLGIGALASMPAAGALSSRFGCKTLLLASTALFALLLPLIPLVSSVWLLALLLIGFGIGIGATDCVMNVQAILVEKQAGKALMSGFHGFYSLGGIAGAGLMALQLSLGLNAFIACVNFTVLIILLLLANHRGLLPYANPKEGRSFAWPKGTVLLIGLICFSLFLAEGTVLDWSGVYLTEYRGLAQSSAALGLFCFSITMTFGRLTGDWLISHLGARLVMTVGGLVASAGLVLAISTSSIPVALLGYALVGLGCANIVPVMFSATGKQTVMPQAIAVPAVTTLGYIGVLAGPASVGALAQYFTLPVALYCIAALIALATLLSTKVRV